MQTLIEVVKQKSDIPILRQVVVYILFGLVTASVDFGTYKFMLMLSFPISLAKGMSYLCGLLVSYCLNRNIVFKYSGSHERFYRFLILATANLVINIMINNISLGILGPDKINAGYMIAMIVTVVCSFWGQKLWVFRSCESSKGIS